MMNFQLAEIIFVWMCAATGATISDEEWDAAYIYLAFVFQKSGKSTNRRKNVPRGTHQTILPEDIGFLQ
jgi:hypothetical protein